MSYAIPAQTRIGHVHLKVSNIGRALTFYKDLLGFEITQHYGDSAVFLSAGGYHHHLGMNIWESRNGQPAPASSVGLREFSIYLPDIAERDRLTAQIKAAGVSVERTGDTALVHDPFQNQISLAVRQ